MIAVWSSLPPCVPTPAVPRKAPKSMPFSMQPKYDATSSVERSAACHSLRSARPARAARAVATPTTSALELDMPAARGKSLANTRSRPSGAPGKFCASRRATTCTYEAQPVRVRASSAGSMSAATSDRTSLTRTRPSLRGPAATAKPRGTAATSVRPPP